MGKQKNRVTKWSPVSPMDFPRFESWLEEMAGKGFLVHRVQQNLFSLARVKFRRDEPHPHRRYRVCPAQGQQQSQEKPSQELLELYAGAGWTYEGDIGRPWTTLYLFSTDDPEAPEPNPDPQTLELALKPLVRTAVRNLRLEVSFGIFVLFLCILQLPCFMPRLWENGIPAFFICFIPLALLNLWDAKRANRVLQDLRRRLQEGDPLPPRPGPFSSRQTILRLTLQLLLVAVLL